MQHPAKVSSETVQWFKSIIFRQYFAIMEKVVIATIQSISPELRYNGIADKLGISSEVEQALDKGQVAGSNPASPTKEY